MCIYGIFFLDPDNLADLTHRLRYAGTGKARVHPRDAGPDMTVYTWRA